MRISLLDGSCYIGQLGRVSFDPNDDVQEIEILNPYVYVKPKAKVKKIHETASMLLQGNAIISIEKIRDQEARKLYDLPVR